eukprot:5522861-Prorocentrum_lima.AAC.1
MILKCGWSLHAQHQSSEETHIQSKIASMQERIGVEELAARNAERQKCQQVIDETIKQRDATLQTTLKQKTA